MVTEQQMCRPQNIDVRPFVRLILNAYGYFDQAIVVRANTARLKIGYQFSQCDSKTATITPRPEDAKHFAFTTTDLNPPFFAS
jgi:hypothetical protein